MSPSLSFSFLLLLICGFCEGAGFSPNITRWVIYAVPIAMGLTVTVSMLVILGMLIQRCSEPPKEEKEKKRPVEGAVNIAMEPVVD